MIDLAAFFRRAHVCAIHAAGTINDCLGIRKVVVWWRIRDDEIGVVTEDAERVGIIRRDRPRDVAGKPRIHDADVA